MTVVRSIRIRKGLDLPIAGEPEQRIEQAVEPRCIALLAVDYIGLRPTMFVRVGDPVRRGQVLFEDKKNPGVRYTSPGAGTVVAINRGERRALHSVVIELNERERGRHLASEDAVKFQSYAAKDLPAVGRDDIRALLLESGQWTALRTRPFSKVPKPDTVPHSIFVTAMDTNPLAPSVDVVMKGYEEDFERGVEAVAKLTDGPTYLCKGPRSSIPANFRPGTEVVEFDGPHPTGTVGVHIHFLDPVHREKTVWHLNYQEVIAIGRLLSTGQLSVERTISLAGPQVLRPRLLQTRLGASTDDLVAGELRGGENRVISGSVLSGRSASGEIHGFLGRYHHQISAVREGRERVFLGWLLPGKDKFSTINLFASRLYNARKFAFTTSLNGGVRPIMPIGMYERVMPMDILPTHLLRALCVGNLEGAEQLGALDLDEEDLALCTFVSPSKIDYGPILRSNLEQIEREG